MSGYYHRHQESISPYSMGNASDSDDETYLQMDQFHDKDSNSRISNIRSNLKNILSPQNDDHSVLPRPNYRLPSGYSDWPSRSGNSKLNELADHRPKPTPRSTVPNYSKCDPAKKASRAPASVPPGNSPVLSRLPLKSTDGLAVTDDQEDSYLTFESSAPDQSFLGYGPGQLPRRQLAPHSVEEPPPRPPRSPAKLPSGYDDHTLPFRLPPFEHDQPPERPPPPPPTQMSPNHATPPYSPFSRHGSDKSSSSLSPASSRPPSMKNQGSSHLLERRSNYSTESSGSTSSDESAKRSPVASSTSSKFVPMRPDRQFPKIHSMPRTSLPILMPSFDPPSTSLEDQLYFKNVDREKAQDTISSVKQDGAFLVRPRNESSKPYALTLWANNKFYNFLIRKRTVDGKYALGREKEDEKAFDSVTNLIEHFRTHDVVLAESEGSVKLTISPV